MNIAIIPARGGSKRIPRKNIKRFVGKPMIAYAVEAARSCDAIERVVVSTDDEEIADISRELGAELPFDRPAALADDLTPTVAVVAHAIEACRKQGWSVRNICCIYPAVPFLLTDDLMRAFTLLESLQSNDFVFPIAEFPAVIQRALRRQSDGRVEPFDRQHVSTRTQDLEPVYFDAGQFYWGAAETWLSGLDIHTHGRSIVLPGWRAIDIDTPEDWDRAELIYRSLAAPE